MTITSLCIRTHAIIALQRRQSAHIVTIYCGTIMVILLFAQKKVLQMWAVFFCTYGPQVVKNRRLIKTSLTFGCIIYRRNNVVAFNVQLSCLLSTTAKNLSYTHTTYTCIFGKYCCGVANQRTSAESSKEY